MRTVAYILIIMLVFLLLLAYGLLVVASEADEQAERMYRKWRENKNDE